MNNGATLPKSIRNKESSEKAGQLYAGNKSRDRILMEFGEDKYRCASLLPRRALKLQRVKSKASYGGFKSNKLL